MLNLVSQPWTSSSHHKLCTQVLHESWTKHYHQESSGPWATENALASCLKELGVHQLNAEYIWSCKPRLHDNLGLTGVRQKIASQHHSTGKHAIFHQSSLCTSFCFLLWSFPPISGLSLQDNMSPTNQKEGRKHVLKIRALRWLSRVWPPAPS